MLLNKKALFKDFSADDKTGGNYNGYNKLYKDLVDQDKDSYQIVLGSNGTVYYVTNYWKGNYDKKAVQTYKVAPDDMQEAYQELLKHYSSASTSESSESSSSSQSSSAVINIKLIRGQNRIKRRKPRPSKQAWMLLLSRTITSKASKVLGRMEMVTL
ncbi:MAG: hypothetical protein ACLUP5_08485 [Streptococcus sp.]